MGGVSVGSKLHFSDKVESQFGGVMWTRGWVFSQMFKSHCAPEPPVAEAPGAAAPLSKLTVAALKARLQALGQPVDGKKVRWLFL